MMRRLGFGASFRRWATEFVKVIAGAKMRDYSRGGIEVEGETTEEEITGIIVPLTNEDLRHEEGGTYTRHDRKVYVQDPEELEIGQLIIHEGKTYRVHEQKDYGLHTDVRIYFARRLKGEG